MFVLIGPHIRPHEIKTVWTVLAERGLDPEPFADCPRRVFTREHGLALIAALPDDAPIKEPEDGQSYTMIRLRADTPSVRRRLENALASSIRGTAKIPRWRGGKKQPRPVRLQEHPEASLREIMIVPDETSMPYIESFFINRENPDIAA